MYSEAKITICRKFNSFKVSLRYSLNIQMKIKILKKLCVTLLHFISESKYVLNKLCNLEVNVNGGSFIFIYYAKKKYP